MGLDRSYHNEDTCNDSHGFSCGPLDVFQWRTFCHTLDIQMSDPLAALDNDQGI